MVRKEGIMGKNETMQLESSDVCVCKIYYSLSQINAISHGSDI